MTDLSSFVPPIVWVCRGCNARDVTRHAGPHTRFHACSGMDGLTMPMIREGERVKVTVNEREDYIDGDDVPFVDGRPIMNVTTTRDDGEDVAVYAPTAHGGRRD